MSGKENKVPLKYKSVDELKSHYDRLQLEGRNPRDLLQKLDPMFKRANEYFASGSVEDAYIIIMKYMNVFSFIQNCEDYKKDSKYYKSMLGRQPIKAMELAENWHRCLCESYEMLKINNFEKKSDGKSTLKNINLNTEMPDMRVKKESKSIVTSANLFSMLRDGTKVLIMDIRSELDFDSSRINDSMINIPEELISKGYSANMLEQKLSDSSKNLWKLRANYDQIVLIDWMTNEKTFNQSKLSILKDILTEWDVNTTYKNEILFLDGGYEDWLNSYPWSTTNPKPQRPLMEDAVSDAILDQVIYPDLDDLNANVEQEFLKPFFDRSKKPLKRSLNDEYGADELIEPSIQPSFDRAKKPAAIKSYEEHKNDVDNLINQQMKETSEALVLEKSRLDHEKEFQDIIYEHSEKILDENEKKISEEKEKQLLNMILKIEELEEKSVLKDNKIKELEKTLELYKKKDTEEMAKKEEDEERKIKEAEIILRQREIEKFRIAKEREKIEKVSERKMLEEKYREKLAIARKKKKKLTENNFPSSTDFTAENDNFNRIPVINRSNKPRVEEKTRQFNGDKGNVGKGLTGLKNLGNTCYMNSIIQCISNNPTLVQFICKNFYRDLIHRGSKTKGEVAEELAAVVKTLWSGHYRSIACIDFKRTVGMFKPEYANFEQQDSHEFLTFLMDWLHNDLNKISNIESMNIENEMNEMEKAWWNFEQKNGSLISKLFYGLQKSTVSCTKCDEESVTYEPFSNFSLIIPDSEYSSIEQCLKLYLKSERISGWRCPKCKVVRDAEKKTDICKLPPYLIIHLKRFHYIEVLSRKRTSYVDFPLNDLNMLQFVSCKKERHTNYNLYAISNHYGTMEGGHYTAFCKSPLFKKWYKFDDHEVYEISSNEVKTNAAYILFYSLI